MKSQVLYIALLLIFISVNLLADVRIFLFPSVVTGKENIRLGDIARVECPEGEVDILRGVMIGKNMFKNGYVESGDLRKILNAVTEDNLFIYGNAVKIIVENAVADEKREKNSIEIIIKTGDAVKLAIIRKGIRIEVDGIAAVSGAAGDSIPVKIKNNKSLKGIIINKRLIETDL